MDEKKVFTIEEIDDAINCMEQRLQSGQGDMTSAMCRLSLPMTRWLRAQLKMASAHAESWKEHWAEEFENWKDAVNKLHRLKRMRLEASEARVWTGGGIADLDSMSNEMLVLISVADIRGLSCGLLRRPKEERCYDCPEEENGE